MQKTKLGNISTKFGPGHTWKRHLRTEEIVRLVLAGYSDFDIAISQNITVVRVGQIKRTPEYIAKRLELATGVIAKQDLFLRDSIEARHAELASMVPSALLALRNSLLQQQNPKLQFEAAKEILDREGSLAKVSKTTVTHRAEYDYSQDDKVSDDLLSALQSSTGTAHSVMDAGLDVFSSASLGKDAQKELQDKINLADFNLGSIQ